MKYSVCCVIFKVVFCNVRFRLAKEQISKILYSINKLRLQLTEINYSILPRFKICPLITTRKVTQASMILHCTVIYSVFTSQVSFISIDPKNLPIINISKLKGMVAGTAPYLEYRSS